jgi:Predicted membrane protein (DUF2127)
MVSAAKQPSETSALERSVRSDRAQDQSRLLPVLAVERSFVRCFWWVSAWSCWPIPTLTGPTSPDASLNKSDWTPATARPANWSRAWTGFGPRQAQRDGAIAIAYGALEAAEGYGLLRRRSWDEYLTIVSTAVLLIPEIQELFKHPTGLKVGGLALNVVIVIYLIIRLVGGERTSYKATH